MGATRKQQSRVTENLRQSDVIRAAIDYGIDIEMLIDNSKRSPDERIRRHQIALDTVRMLQKAKKLKGQ